jgi:hypothetical protein
LERIPVVFNYHDYGSDIMKLIFMAINETVRHNRDPYHAAQSLETKSGLISSEPAKVQPGAIVYFTFAGNRLVTVNTVGEVTKELTHPINGDGHYDYYRPVKPAVAEDGFMCVLSDKSEPKKKRSIGLVDKTGHVVWATKPLPLSHDFHMAGNKIYTILREDAQFKPGNTVSNNVIVELDKTGDIFWRWSVLEHLVEFEKSDQLQAIMAAKKTNNNPFHINSIQYVDSESIIKQFDEPIIVVSSRNMNLIFFVGRKTGKVIYELGGMTKGQHNAHIIESGLSGENHLLIFDNRNDHEKKVPDGNSRVIEVDIASKKIVWSYESKPGQPVFFTPIVGSAQRLPNGNTLICQGYYGRIFEVDQSGNIVWDFTNPFVNIGSNFEEQGPREIFTAIKY